MKKINRTASLTLLAAMGIAVMGSCSSSDDVTPEPTVNPGDAVKTSFTLSIGLPQSSTSGAKAATRVADNIAQVDGVNDFRGIDNIVLIPFSGSSVTATSERLGSNIPLPNATQNSLAKSDIANTVNAHVYNDVTIPLNTNSFLFYGKAVDNTVTSSLTELTGDDAFTYGTIKAEGLTGNTPDGIKFTPKQIVAEGAATNAVATTLADYLTSIATTSYTPDGATASSTWRDYATTAANSGKPLKELYDQFIALAAGSSASVEAAAQDLYTSLRNLVAGSGNNLSADEMKLRDAIVSNLTANTYVTSSTDGTLTFATSMNGYPANIYLPDGAATVKYNAESNKFEPTTDNAILNDGTQVASINSYAYPANLWYYANTDIKTSEKSLSDQYQTGTQWEGGILDLYESNGPVTATTRSIALRKHIQYAVGRLNAVVKAGASTLYDRQGDPVTVDDNTFTVTGILVGGQRQVDWQFEPVANTDAAQYILYDKAQANNNITVASGSKANNTLALESKDGETVNVVVELQNNGKAFYGKDGLVPTGTKFYLVAKLDPTNTTSAQQPQDGNVNKVFKQDYVTNATLTINVNDETGHNKGLGNAYNVIPDLRNPVLSLGLAVDLTWKNGLTFNVDM